MPTESHMYTSRAEIGRLRAEVPRLESKYASLYSAVAAIVADPCAVDKAKIRDIKELIVGHSAKVSMHLTVDGLAYDVAQSCQDRVVLVEPRVMPSGPAILWITIDGQTDRHDVVLVGEAEATREVRIKNG
jgi:hypothetical protein